MCERSLVLASRMRIANNMGDEVAPYISFGNTSIWRPAKRTVVSCSMNGIEAEILVYSSGSGVSSVSAAVFAEWTETSPVGNSVRFGLTLPRRRGTMINSDVNVPVHRDRR